MQRAFGPVRSVEVLHGEGGGESDASRIAMLQRDGGTLLLRNWRKVRIVDVDGQDAEVIVNGLRHEPIRLALNMHMRIDLLDSLEIRERVVVGAGSAVGAESRATPAARPEQRK